MGRDARGLLADEELCGTGAAATSCLRSDLCNATGCSQLVFDQRRPAFVFC